MRKPVLLLAALPCLAAGAAAAADLDYVAPRQVRAVTVTHAALACPPVPAVAARGRRGMGEPGTFYAYWGWKIPYSCNFVFGR